MPDRLQPAPLPEGIELASLAHFVGHAFNAQVARRLRDAGYPEVKTSFGYVIQHLVGGPRSGAELARRMGITQQAASKRLQAMREAGLVEEVEGADARHRRVALSVRGHQLLSTARELRLQEDARVWRGVRAADLRLVRSALATALRNLGAEEAIARRELQEPD